MEKKWVVASDHGPVPKEENSTRYITDEPVEIDASTMYYARRLMQGELVECDAPAAPHDHVMLPPPVPEEVRSGYASVQGKAFIARPYANEEPAVMASAPIFDAPDHEEK